MKNFTLALLGLLALVSYPAAEVIDTVTFNPARLGQYERLKVSDGLTSHGGVQAQSAQVQAAGTATAANEANYRIPQVQVNGSLNMPSTRFETPKLNSRGGTAYFDETAGTDIQSHIDTLTQTALRVKANVLEAQNIQVQGVPSGDYDGNTVQGLKLGGNDIPKREGCSGLDWVDRTDASGNTYKVLGMRNCGEGECVPTYGEVSFGPVTDTCPGEDPVSPYICSGGFKGECIDVLKIPGQEDGEEDKQTSSSLASFVEPDTCNGDVWNKYTCSAADKAASKTCYDIYLSNKNTMGSVYRHAGKCEYDSLFTYNWGCSFYAMTQLDYSEGLAAIYADPSAKCLRLIQGYSKGGVGGKCTFNSSGDRCAYPQYGGYYFFYLSCNPRYTREKVYCGGKTVPYVKVKCCGE